MTFDEAIEEMENIYQNGFNNDFDNDEIEKPLDAIRMAINALGKQTPKKPIERIVDTGLNLKIPYKIYLCPNHRCRMTVKQFEGYCHECWQRIDWWKEE